MRYSFYLEFEMSGDWYGSESYEQCQPYYDNVNRYPTPNAVGVPYDLAFRGLKTKIILSSCFCC